MSQSEPIYKALERIEEELTGAQRRVVEMKVKGMQLSGVGLEKRDEFARNTARLSELATEFSNNVLDATKTFQLELTEEDAEGLPPSALQMAKERSNSDALYVLGLDAPSYIAAMKYLKSSELREKLYKAFITRGAPENEGIINEILKLRARQAELLGYKNFAEVSLAMKMAESVEKIKELQTMIFDKAKVYAQKEMNELQEFVGHDVKHWDVAYYSEKLRESKFGFSEEELRPYFPLDNVLTGLFSLFEKLFCVQVEEVTGEKKPSVWHDDVRYYKVMKSGDIIAGFYLDPYARPENKRGGAWMDVAVGKSKTLQRDVPVAYLNCNGSPPTEDAPSLMTFNEVTTLFHEAGHASQHILTTVDEGDVAGISGIEWDAVELASQFLENWLYDKNTLDSFAKHYQTGEPLPNDLFQKLRASKDFQAGMRISRQLAFGVLDLELHSTNVSPFDLQSRIFQEYLPMAPIPEDKFLTAFNHIFAGGYAAGYYSYIYAEVLSADCFAAFEEVGLDNDDAVKELGIKYRDTILALGGSQHPADVFRQFRGRDPDPMPLLRHSGLI